MNTLSCRLQNQSCSAQFSTHSDTRTSIKSARACWLKTGEWIRYVITRLTTLQAWKLMFFSSPWSSCLATQFTKLVTRRWNITLPMIRLPLSRSHSKSKIEVWHTEPRTYVILLGSRTISFITSIRAWKRQRRSLIHYWSYFWMEIHHWSLFCWKSIPTRRSEISRTRIWSLLLLLQFERHSIRYTTV